MEKLLKTYRKRLYDLTTANRSLLFLRLSSTQDLDLSELDYLDQHPAFHLLEELLTEKKKIKLCPVQEPRVEKVQEVSSVLKKIQRKLFQISEERGVYELFVGCFFAEGKWKDGTPFRAPLIFFPVKLEMEGNYWYLMREERSIQLNKSLLLAFSHYHDLAIGDDFIEEDFEEYPADALAFRTKLYEWFRESPLEFLFSKDYFSDRFNNIKEYKKQEYEEIHRAGEMHVTMQAALGIFPQAGSVIAADYDTWMKDAGDTTLEEFFNERDAVLTEPDSLKEDLMTPFSMDASQEFAIRQVLSGKSMVIQGPPGSGKSETICNLICTALAKGKKVLVVSHKRAALEVVANRLGQKGIQDFYALVHDIKFDQRALYANLNTQIGRLDEYQTVNNGLDTIYLEREFANSVKTLTQLTRQSEEFRTALFDTQLCGYSAHELYLRIEKNIDTINVSDVYKQYTRHIMEEFIQKIRSYRLYRNLVFPHIDIWKHRKEIPDIDRSKLNEWKTSSAKYVESIHSLKGIVQTYSADWDASVADRLIQSHGLVRDIRIIFQSSGHAVLWNSIREKQWYHSLAEASGAIHHLHERFNALYTSRTLEEIKALYNTLERAKEKAKNPAGWFFYTLFSKDYKDIKQAAALLQAEAKRSSISTLHQTVREALTVEQHTAHISSALYHPAQVHSGSFHTSFHESIGVLKNILDVLQAEHPLIHQHLLLKSSEEVVRFSEAMADAAQKLKQYINESGTFLTEEQQEIFTVEPEQLNAWMLFTENNLDDLYQLDRLLVSFSPADRLCLERLKNHTTDKQEAQWPEILEQSVLHNWIQHIEMLQPVLRSIDTISWQQHASEWSTYSEKRKEISLHMILNKLREHTYRDIEYNRLQNRVTYRDVQHQVSKKKRIWPVRKLMQEYADELFNLIPCWMMSPEQVSSVFPMRQLFDIIVIDEASQCYTEHGLPAILRAKQVVIAGDSQQLPPSDLYRVRWEDEEEEQADAEIDSLLDLGSRYLSGMMLNGHYRSRYPELISFSNNRFYGNKLNYIPEQKDIASAFKPVVYKKVNGVWANHTNTVEAEEVAKITFEKIVAGIRSIGIVCFNFQQAMCIQDLLEEEALAKKITLPSELFVKNIENVQGDERDLIIFSVGYAPDKNGRFPMQFGSLNLQGGEKRLNVAVTRAREQVIIVSSIMPQELKTDTVKHQGPAVLKEYLQYAWDCQQYDRTSFFTRHAKDPERLSTAEKIIQKFGEHTNPSVKSLYPFASLAVTETGKADRLVDTDDSAYYKTAYAKYWHFEKPMMFMRKGWNYKQIFSRLFYTSPKEDIQKRIFHS